MALEVLSLLLRTSFHTSKAHFDFRAFFIIFHCYFYSEAMNQAQYFSFSCQSCLLFLDFPGLSGKPQDLHTAVILNQAHYKLIQTSGV